VVNPQAMTLVCGGQSLSWSVGRDLHGARRAGGYPQKMAVGSRPTSWRRSSTCGDGGNWSYRWTDDFWQHALFAAIAYIRAAADRAGVRSTLVR
jgi:hypothetical protein